MIINEKVEFEIENNLTRYRKAAKTLKKISNFCLLAMVLLILLVLGIAIFVENSYVVTIMGNKMKETEKIIFNILFIFACHIIPSIFLKLVSRWLNKTEKILFWRIKNIIKKIKNIKNIKSVENIKNKITKDNKNNNQEKEDESVSVFIEKD
jgi:hypothetical protein